MGRRIDIELTSTRDDGTWTWRAAGARQPKGTVDGDLLPDKAGVGDVLRAEVEDFLEGLQITSVLPPKESRNDPRRLELVSESSDGPLVTSTRVKRSREDRGGRRGAGGQRSRGPGDRQVSGGRRGAGSQEDRDRGGDRDRDRPGRARQRAESGGSREGRRSGPPPDAKPKPKRLRPSREHRKALLDSLKAEERPVAEQVLQGGIPAVREAIKKQNEELRADSKPEMNAEPLLQMAERIRPKALAATWRDRADAALRKADELDLRDLRSVVNAAGDAGRDQESREVADQLRAALAERVEAEQAAWIAEVAENLKEERVVRALRLSSRPPKAGQPLPGELTQQLVAATNLALTSETGQQRWATILDALAYSPIRRRVVPESLPEKLGPELREMIAKLATRLPEIAHIFDISADDAPPKPRRARTKSQGKKGEPSKSQRKKGEPTKGQRKKDAKAEKPDGADEAEAEAKAKVAENGEAEAGSSEDVPSVEAAEPVAEVEVEGAEPVAEAPEVDDKKDEDDKPGETAEPTPAAVD